MSSTHILWFDTDMMTNHIKALISGDHEEFVIQTMPTKLMLKVGSVDTKKVRNAIREWLDMPERRQYDRS